MRRDRDKNDTNTERRTMTKRQNIGHNEKKVYKTHHTLCEAAEEIEEEDVAAVDDEVSTENSQPLIKLCICICIWLVYQERSLHS